MNKINDKGVRDGVWVTEGVNMCGTCTYVDLIFGFAQSSMQGRWERSSKSENEFEVCFMNKSVLEGEYIKVLL